MSNQFNLHKKVCSKPLKDESDSSKDKVNRDGGCMGLGNEVDVGSSYINDKTLIDDEEIIKLELVLLEQKYARLEKEFLDIVQSKKWKCLVYIVTKINTIPFTNTLKVAIRKVCQLYSNLWASICRIKQRMRVRSFINRFNHAVLIFDHDLGGGANHYRCQVIDSLIKNKKKIILLKNRVIRAKHRYFEFRGYDKDGKKDLKVDLSQSVFDILDQSKVSEVIYNSLVYYPNIISFVKYMHHLSCRGARLKVLLHDFFPICPSYNLIVAGGVCGLGRDGSCLSCLDSTTLEHVQEPVNIEMWRKEWMALLLRADEIICFSLSSKKIISSVYTKIDNSKFKIIPHSMDYFRVRKPLLRRGVSPCIGVVGNITSIAKGKNILSLLAGYLLDYYPDIKIIVIGEYNGTKYPNVHITGQYRLEALSDIIEENHVNIFLHPSVCPETFSYVASELIMLEVPLLCFDLGAQAEKVKKYNKGLIIPEITPESTMLCIEQVYNRIYSQESR